MSDRKLSFDTLQLHAGQKPDPSPGQIRLSIGIEDIEDLLWDLGQALG